MSDKEKIILYITLSEYVISFLTTKYAKGVLSSWYRKKEYSVFLEDITVDAIVNQPEIVRKFVKEFNVFDSVIISIFLTLNRPAYERYYVFARIYNINTVLTALAKNYDITSKDPKRVLEFMDD